MPERYPHDDPREWLNRARSNLVRAKSPIPGAYLEDHCFDAQQAAEKAVKAVMISRGAQFPYVHDIAHLLSVLEATGEHVPEAVRDAERLTQYAFVTRYPTTNTPVSEHEHAEAVEMAHTVVRRAEERI